MQLKRRQWLGVFILPAAGWTLALIVTHQSIIAASSYFLTRLIEAFQRGADYGPYLFLYLGAMLIPYIPGCASLLTLQVWINQAHSHFTNRFSKAAYGRPEKHRDSVLREAVESISARNSFIALKDYLTFAHGFVGFALNSALSIIVLSLLLPGNLVTGYIVSLALSISLILLLRSKVSCHSTQAEQQFILYSESLSRIWDNSTLGNQYNFQLWEKSRDQRATAYYRQSNRLQLLKQLGNLSLAFVALVPTVYLILHAIGDPSTKPVLIAAIIVNLTRIFHILNSLSALVYQLLDFSAMNARLRVIFDAEEKFYEPSNLPEAPYGDVYLNGEQVRDFYAVAATLRSADRGRFTIRGGNGSGKSTLLHVLKHVLADEAILIPAQHGKLHWRDEVPAQSTGQRKMAQLNELAKHPKVKYLLLDEWDANLDTANTHLISELLEQVGLNKVIVEIRH